MCRTTLLDLEYQIERFGAVATYTDRIGISDLPKVVRGSRYSKHATLNNKGVKLERFATQSLSQPFMIGELAVSFGYTTSENVEQMLSLALISNQNIGRIMVAEGTLSQAQLKAILQCQSLMRDKLCSTSEAKIIMGKVSNGLSIEECVESLSIKPMAECKGVLLGQLLVEAEWLKSVQLENELAKQRHSILPLGAMLVSDGLISENLLAAAINAQAFIRSERLTRVAATDSLRELKSIRLQSPSSYTAREKPFNLKMQNRVYPRLGELLVQCGIISIGELAIVLQRNITEKTPTGMLLVQSKYLDKKTLDVALELQKLVRIGSLSVSQAIAAIHEVRRGKDFLLILRELKGGDNPDEVPSLLNLLKQFGCLTDAQLTVALDFAQQNSEILSKILLMTGLQSPETLEKIEECRTLIQQKQLTQNDAKNIFEISNKDSVSISQAIQNLRSEPESSNPAQLIAPVDENDWRKIWKAIETLLSQHDFRAARKKIEQAKSMLTERDQRVIACFDAIAGSYEQEQNYELAERFSTYALDKRLELFEFDSLQCAAGMDALAKLLYFQRRYSEAEKFAKEFVRICSKRLGPSHINVACGWQNIATIYLAQRRYSYAEHAYQLAIRGCTESVGEHHPITVNVKRSYANLLHQMDRAVEAQKLHLTANGTSSGDWRTIDFGESSIMEVLQHL